MQDRVFFACEEFVEGLYRTRTVHGPMIIAYGHTALFDPTVEKLEAVVSRLVEVNVDMNHCTQLIGWDSRRALAAEIVSRLSNRHFPFTTEHPDHVRMVTRHRLNLYLPPVRRSNSAVGIFAVWQNHVRWIAGSHYIHKLAGKSEHLIQYPRDVFGRDVFYNICANYTVGLSLEWSAKRRVTRIIANDFNSRPVVMRAAPGIYGLA